MSAAKTKRDGGYVTRAECSATMSGLSEQMSTVMEALVGKNLQGGLVLAMSEVKATVNTLVAEKAEGKEKREERVRWKLAALGLAATLIGIVANHFLHYFT